MVPIQNIIKEAIAKKANSGGLLQARLRDKGHGDVDYDADYQPKPYQATTGGSPLRKPAEQPSSPESKPRRKKKKKAGNNTNVEPYNQDDNFD